MSEAAFLAPRRRAVVYEAYEAPFPVPRSDAEATRCGDGVYRADLVNQQVLVRDPAHIKLLYGQVQVIPLSICRTCLIIISITDSWFSSSLGSVSL